MNKYIIYLGLFVFSLGLFSLGWTISNFYDAYFQSSDSAKNSGLDNEFQQTALSQNYSKELHSPQEWVKKEQIFVYEDEVVIKVNNSYWVTFTDTNSMDPVIDSTTKAIQIMPKSEDNIHVGDIVAYKSSYKDKLITHRVVDIGYDANGWYARLKGDNNEHIDPEKVRFEQIKLVVVAIIY